ncbi:MAG: NAD-dependent epimerase/dehydratase family protein [Candidatus Roizmanbacteria bacterium]|nr:MAG: NAD-dependent epimerase/dehydratase family protein [Candidatus Roizmanbacteria bacterium]
MKNKPLNYLITGGLGLIGSNLANNLQGKITVISRSNKHLSRLNNKKAKLIIKSVHDLNEMDVANIDVIYHFASTVDNYNVLTDPYIDIETNVKDTIHLLEFCKKLRKKPKLIFPSTMFVYGNEYDRTKTPINEESKTDPLAIYPATKLCAESIIKLYSRLYSIPYLICRLTNVYGEYETFDNTKKGALNYLIMEALKGNTLSLYDGGNFYRNYIYVDDVVAALRILEKKANNDTYLIGHEDSIKFKTLINCIIKMTKSKSKVRSVRSSKFHKAVATINFFADTSKIRSLGWKPIIGHKEGLKKIVKRYKKLLNS